MRSATRWVPGNRAGVGKALDALIATVAEHFASEEANFSKHGYPDAASHKQEHDKLVATCLDLQKKFHAGQAEVTGETAGFVVGWLTNHIPSLDKRYGPTSTPRASLSALSARTKSFER